MLEVARDRLGPHSQACLTVPALGPLGIPAVLGQARGCREELSGPEVAVTQAEAPSSSAHGLQHPPSLRQSPSFCLPSALFHLTSPLPLHSINIFSLKALQARLHLANSYSHFKTQLKKPISP